MVPRETRNRIRARVGQWQARLEQLRAERKELTGEARRKHIQHLQKLQSTIVEEAREWQAGIDDYDADSTRTTQKEFEEQVGLRELKRQVTSDLAAWEREGHGVG